MSHPKAPFKKARKLKLLSIQGGPPARIKTTSMNNEKLRKFTILNPSTFHAGSVEERPGLFYAVV
jgi:hypothetical protein